MNLLYPNCILHYWYCQKRSTHLDLSTDQTDHFVVVKWWENCFLKKLKKFMNFFVMKNYLLKKCTLKPRYSKKVCQTFFSLYQIILYIKCNMLSKSSKWELGFVHYIVKFTISRFVILRFENIYFLAFT